jgi:hypothetical protein
LEGNVKKVVLLIVVLAVGGALILGLFSTMGPHAIQALFWIVGLGAGAWLYVRAASKRDEDRLERSGDRLLERPSVTLDPNRLEGRAQAQADRFSNSPRNIRR